MMRTVKGFSRCALLSLCVICNLPCGRAGRENLLGLPLEKVDLELRLGLPNHYNEGTLPFEQDEANNPKRLKSAVRTSLMGKESSPFPLNQVTVAKSLREDITGGRPGSAQGSRGWHIQWESESSPVDTPDTIGSLFTLGGDTPLKRKRPSSPVVKNMLINPNFHMTESGLQGYTGDTHAARTWADRQIEPGHEQRFASGDARPSDMLGPASFYKQQKLFNENNVRDRRYAHVRTLKGNPANAGRSRRTGDRLGGGGIVAKENPVGQSEKSILRPEGEPEARKIISFEPLSVIRFPRVLPNDSDRKKLVTLADAWTYNQNLDQLKEEISILKVKFMNLVYISERIQHMMQKLQSCLGSAMPRHEWFSNYGDRVFPDIVAMHLNQISENEILDSQVYLVKKWASVIDFICAIQRTRPNKMLLHSDALIRVLDAMIKARLDRAGLENLLKFTLSFTNSKHLYPSPISKDEEIRKVDWLIKGIVMSSNCVYQQELMTHPEVGIKFHDWSNAAFTKSMISQVKLKSNTKRKLKQVSGPHQEAYLWFEDGSQLGRYFEKLSFYFVLPTHSIGRPPISPPDLLNFYLGHCKPIENPMTSIAYGKTIVKPLTQPTEEEGQKSFQDLLDTATHDVEKLRKDLSWTSEIYVSENMWKFITLMLKESKHQDSFRSQFKRILEVMHYVETIHSQAEKRWALQQISPLIIFGSKPELVKEDGGNRTSLLRDVAEYVYNNDSVKNLQRIVKKSSKIRGENKRSLRQPKLLA